MITVFYRQIGKIVGVLSIVIFMAVFSISVSAEEETPPKSVQVIGTGTVVEKNAAKAREEAISAALIQAVDQVCLSFVSAKDLAREFHEYNAAMHGKTEKFIRKYQVLAEEMLGDRYRVVVLVDVLDDELKRAVKTAGVVPEPVKNNPKVLLLISESNVGEYTPRYWWALDLAFLENITDQTFRKVLGEKGFVVVDHGFQIPDREFEFVMEKPELNDREAVGLGRLFHADVVIVGKASADMTKNTMGSDIRSFQGTVAVRVVSVESGEVIAEVKDTEVKVNADGMEGGKQALISAATKTAVESIEKIAATRETTAPVSDTIRLIVGGEKFFGSFIMLRRALNDFPGVESMKLNEMNSNSATLEIRYDGEARDLADMLMTKSFDTFSINIYDVSRNYIRVEIVPTR